MSPAMTPTASTSFAAPRMRGHRRLLGVFNLVITFAFRRSGHIDAPAREFGGQAGILSLLADSQRELMCCHRDQGGMIGLAQFNFEWLDGAERVGDKNSRIRTPLDNVNLLVVQFVNDIVNA